ncbi:Metallo-dependent phosphatase [Dissoconium aciculare CBS 342.82]|uniref:Metallo-dependent phosphatase n=1 Tax=Dissoconium aciculare CBS 342.82 TaxID=1314786 RepID=A0A6J3M2N3_9PEZI|nr:Metallo-dependent phosphatase [Dissoconium aciculare CBS 342.82]KAF1822275.1 Metallo-dependent phosphatase [Dissoconium aciculare CBS 342.82]
MSNDQLPRKPLIEQVTNKWRDQKSDPAQKSPETLDEALCSCDLEDDASFPNATYRLVTSHRFRRLVILVATIALALGFTWKEYIGPQIHRQQDLLAFMSPNNGTYGIAQGGHDKDLVKIMHLDPSLIPGGQSDPEGRRRLIFIGDVHGCRQELQHVLRKSNFNEETDQLILVGDVVSKGPDSPGTLDELIKLNAISVRGNHEDRLLTAAKLSGPGQNDDPTTVSTSSKGAAKDALLLRHMKPHHLHYLRKMPLILHIPALPMALPPSKSKHSPIAEHMLVVHAGLVPGVPLERQDPYFVENMRSIHHKTHIPSVSRSGKSDGRKPWIEIWNWYNDRLYRRRSPEVVIYGHDSRAGLQIHRWTKGLDSGCVSGGKLTAMILNAKGEQELVSVACENHRA